MLSQDEQIALFVDAINKNAQKLCKEINKSTQRMYTQACSSLEKEIRETMLERVSYAENEIMAGFNKIIAEKKAEERRNLTEKRRALTDGVFKKAEKKLSDFSDGENYTDFLAESLRMIAAYAGDGFTVLARKKDFDKVKDALKITGLSCTVSEDPSIITGGIKAKSISEDKLFDDTLDRRLSEQREWFLENSSLTVKL